MAHDVFISYSQSDKAAADAVCHRIEDAGIRCWIAPRDIGYGLGWDEAITQAIGETKLAVVIFSQVSTASPQVMNEVAATLEAEATLIPFRIDGVASTDGTAMPRLHWLDTLSAPLDARIDRLIESVRSNLFGAPQEGPSTAAAEAQPMAAAPIPLRAERNIPAEPPPEGAARPPRRWLPLIVAGAAIAVASVVGAASYQGVLFTPSNPAADKPATPAPAAVAAPPVAARPALSANQQAKLEPLPAAPAPAVRPTPAPAPQATPAPLPPVVSSRALVVAGNSKATPIEIPAPTDPRYAASELSITVTELPSNGAVIPTGGAIPVAQGQKLTGAELAGLMFVPAPDAFDRSSALTYTVKNPAELSAEGRVALAIGPKPAEPSPAEAVAAGLTAFQRKDYAESMRWFRIAADKGNVDAINKIAFSYKNGYGVQQDNAEAMRWYRMAADKGNVDAQNNVGLLYGIGLGVKQDYAEAMRWYRLAADKGYAEAQKNVGVLYQNGWGVERDPAEAFRWFRAAADQGDATAQFGVGRLYDTGRGVAKDYAQAMLWYRKAADQRDAKAQAAIGRLYDKGLGVEQNYDEALRWFGLAATQGYAKAQATIGYFYEAGQGITKDYAEAMRWYRLAADQGDATAQSRIGVLYARGRGVERNMAEARTWMEKAAADGDAYAAKWLENH